MFVSSWGLSRSDSRSDLSALTGVEFPEDVLYMNLHRGLADVEPVRDGAIRESVRDQFSYFGFMPCRDK